MAVKKVSLQDLGKEFEKLTKEDLVLLKQATLSGMAESVPSLVEKSPVDTGLYAQSWDFSEAEFGAIIGNYAPHAPIIEYGARPFTPPISPLLAWAKRVLGDSSQPPDYSPEVWALAKGTQNKISSVGIAPKHIMEKEIPFIIERIKLEFKKLKGE